MAKNDKGADLSRTLEPFKVGHMEPAYCKKRQFDQWGENAHGEFNLQTGDFIPWSDDTQHDMGAFGEDHMMWPSQAKRGAHKDKF